QRRLPGVPVRIDKPRQHDEIGCMDMLCVRYLQLRRDGGNPPALDQDVATAQVADRAIHAEDAAAGEKLQVSHRRSSAPGSSSPIQATCPSGRTRTCGASASRSGTASTWARDGPALPKWTKLWRRSI